MSTAADALEVSFVIPCLNEEASIATVVQKALAKLDELGVDGEVVVVDNASEDDSAALASAAGARVVTEPRRGYGSAYLAGLEAARGPLPRPLRRGRHVRPRRARLVPRPPRGAAPTW